MKPTFRPFAAAPILAALMAMGAGSAAVAQDAPPATPASTAPAADSNQDAVEDLIRLLVLRKSITQDEADVLLAKLHSARQAASTAAPATAAGTPPEPQAPAADKGRIRVMYIPESEKQKLRSEIKEEVMQQAQDENWAQPSALPAWIRRISLDGDFRFRQEFDLYDGSNDPNVINFQAINSGAPFDESGVTTPSVPLLDTTQNRELPRFRARLNLNAAIADDLSFDMRMASGNTTNPVSTNQTLGTDFNKTTFTIDRAYLDYHPVENFSAWLGRMPSPWQSTELVWDDDLNFDGIAARYVYSLTPFVKPFVTLGAFSVENTALDFPSTSTQKVASRDKWLFGSQLGLDWKFNRNFKTRSAVAFYDFYHLEGAISSPCSAFTTSVSCDSDDSRPGFIQKGNTLMDLRQLNPNPSNPAGPYYEYYGLATPFRELDATVHVDYRFDEDNDLHVTGDIDYVRNLAYNAEAIYQRSLLAGAGPVNNYGPDGSFQSGNQGLLVEVMLGHPKIVDRWDWNTQVGYRRLESDAVVDAFTDSDFHLGGTNAKGYWVQGNLGFTQNAWFTLRYLSATEVSGSPLAIDVLQLDVNARF